jgi:hypothetical protein
MNLAPGPCPACGGDPIRPQAGPAVTTRRCGPSKIALIVDGRTVKHLGGGEAGVGAAELDARARAEDPYFAGRVAV